MELIEAGITATAGQSVFHFNLFYSGGGSLAVGKNVINSHGQFSTLVNCFSPQALMNHVLETDGSIVIKIDVEGHDFVLSSHLFPSLIDCRRGFLIMVEYIPESHIGSGDLVRDVLQRYYSEGCSIGVLMNRHEVKILESLNDLDSLGACEILIEMAIPAQISP